MRSSGLGAGCDTGTAPQRSSESRLLPLTGKATDDGPTLGRPGYRAPPCLLQALRGTHGFEVSVLCPSTSQINMYLRWPGGAVPQSPCGPVRAAAHCSEQTGPTEPPGERGQGLPLTVYTEVFRGGLRALLICRGKDEHPDANSGLGTSTRWSGQPLWGWSWGT